MVFSSLDDVSVLTVTRRQKLAIVGAMETRRKIAMIQRPANGSEKNVARHKSCGIHNSRKILTETRYRLEKIATSIVFR